MTAATNGIDGLRHWRLLFGAQRAVLDRGSLPSPVSYLTAQGLLGNRPRSEWVSVRCPAHKSGAETHASLRISLVDGHFKCHACGASGGDILALHRLITGRGFRDAVLELGGRFHD
jgi:hypothetical protein